MKKNKLLKDLKKRKLYCKKEKYILILKKMVADYKLKKSLRWQSYFLLQSYHKKYSIVNVRNRCFYTGRSRSINKNLKLSRISIREKGSFGFLPGYKKASW